MFMLAEFRPDPRAASVTPFVGNAMVVLQSDRHLVLALETWSRVSQRSRFVQVAAADDARSNLLVLPARYVADAS
jgi:hypothetical protein